MPDTPSHELDIGLLKELAAKATPGPWRFDGDWHRVPTVLGGEGRSVAYMPKSGFPQRSDHTVEEAANATLIAMLPAIIASLEAQSPDALAAAERRGIERAAEVCAETAAALAGSPRVIGALQCHTAIRHPSDTAHRRAALTLHLGIIALTLGLAALLWSIT